MSEQSFEQHVMALYGKSVYQIELEIATAIFLSNYDGTTSAERAWCYASDFTGAMKAEYDERQ